MEYRVCSMKVIIPRIPKATTKAQLSKLAHKVLDSKFHIPFTQQPKIFSAKIVAITDSNGVV